MSKASNTKRKNGTGDKGITMEHMPNVFDSMNEMS